MSRTQAITVTNMCMIFQGSQVLVQDKVGKDWHGITFPGGHIEQNESFTDAVIREVFEETGLTIQSPRLCGIKDWVNGDGSRYMVLLYKTNQFSGELRASREGAVFWADLESLPERELTPYFAEILRVFLEDDLSEFYYYKQNDTWHYALK